MTSPSRLQKFCKYCHRHFHARGYQTHKKACKQIMAMQRNDKKMEKELWKQQAAGTHWHTAIYIDARTWSLISSSSSYWQVSQPRYAAWQVWQVRHSWLAALHQSMHPSRLRGVLQEYLEEFPTFPWALRCLLISLVSWFVHSAYNLVCRVHDRY